MKTLKSPPILLYGGNTRCNGHKLGIESLKRSHRLLQFLMKNRDYPLLKYLMKKDLDVCLEKLKSSGRINYIPEIIILEEDVWTTAKESLATALWLEQQGIHELIVVSSWYHLPRIHLIWKIIGDFKIHTVAAPSDRISSAFKEILAILKVSLIDRELLSAKTLISPA